MSREEAKRIEAINELYKLEILDSSKRSPSPLPHRRPVVGPLRGAPRGDDGDPLGQAIALQSVAGAYHGDESRDMLQRIYGTAWEDPSQLKVYKKQGGGEEARPLRAGKKLDLFSSRRTGGGLVFWHLKRSAIRRGMEVLEGRARELDAPHDLLYTLHIANLDLWKTRATSTSTRRACSTRWRSRATSSRSSP